MAPSSIDVSVDFGLSDTRTYLGDRQQNFLSPISKQKTAILRSRCVFAIEYSTLLFSNGRTGKNESLLNMEQKFVHLCCQIYPVIPKVKIILVTMVLMEIDFTRNKSIRHLLSDSDSSEEDVEDLPISYEISSWTKQYKIPVLEDFNPGVKQFPSDHTSVN